MRSRISRSARATALKSVELVWESAFIPLIEKTLGHKIEISEDKKVSCSVGISFFDKQYGKNAFEFALKQADDALYYIKRNGKGRYEVWGPDMTQ